MQSYGPGLLLESTQALSHKPYRGYSPILITGAVATRLLTGRPITASVSPRVYLLSRTNASLFV
jgi:hypothetical protein